MVTGDNGAKLENLVACALLKETHFLADVEGINLEMHFIRDKDKREVDFLITKEGTPNHLLEVKWNDADLSPHLKRFLPEQSLRRTQIVGQLETAKSYQTGERVEPALQFLSQLDLRKL